VDGPAGVLQAGEEVRHSEDVEGGDESALPRGTFKDLMVSTRCSLAGQVMERCGG